MIYLITPSDYSNQRDTLDAMYRLRYRIFVKQLNWQVKSQEGMEKDEYDENQTFYLIYKDRNQEVRGCQRYIPMDHPCMFDGPFHFVLPNLKEYKNRDHWESSRMAVDCDYNDGYTKEDARKVCNKILAASMLFGLRFGIKSFITLSYPGPARILSHHFTTSLLARSHVNEEEIWATEYPVQHQAYEKLLKKINLLDNEPAYQCSNNPIYVNFYKK